MLTSMDIEPSVLTPDSVEGAHDDVNLSIQKASPRNFSLVK